MDDDTDPGRPNRHAGSWAFLFLAVFGATVGVVRFYFGRLDEQGQRDPVPLRFELALAVLVLVIAVIMRLRGR